MPYIYHEVEIIEFNEQILFNPYHVGVCLEMAAGTVKDHIRRMNDNQVVKLKNSDVGFSIKSFGRILNSFAVSLMLVSISLSTNASKYSALGCIF